MLHMADLMSQNHGQRIFTGQSLQQAPIDENVATDGGCGIDHGLIEVMDSD